MKRIDIRIECTNCAFEDPCEAARILGTAAASITDAFEGGIDLDKPLRDYNGNTVGRLVMEEL